MEGLRGIQGEVHVPIFQGRKIHRERERDLERERDHGAKGKCAARREEQGRGRGGDQENARRADGGLGQIREWVGNGVVLSTRKREEDTDVRLVAFLQTQSMDFPYSVPGHDDAWSFSGFKKVRSRAWRGERRGRGSHFAVRFDQRAFPRVAFSGGPGAANGGCVGV